MSPKSWIQLGIGVTAFIVWSCDAYFALNLPENYMTFVQGIVVGTAGLALGGRDEHTVAVQPVVITPQIRTGEHQ